MLRPSLVAAILAVCGAWGLAGCAASSNPGKPSSSRWREPEEQAASPEVGKPAAETSAAAPVPQATGDAPAPAAEPPPGGHPLPIARVGDRTIDVRQLLAAWMHANGREVSDLLERLVTAETVDSEARRLGVVLDPALVEEGYREVLAEIEADLKKERPEMDLDTWIRTGLMLDPAGYKEGLRTDVRRRLYAERLIRGLVLTQERANVRVVVTDTREQMQEVQDALAAGRPFEELARERSVDPSSARGGTIPPILRTQSSLSRLAFLTGPGKVGGPIQDAEGGRWMLLRVDSIEPPLEGTWQRIGPAVEASLAARRIEDPEYWQWKAEIAQRYEIDLEPFFRLVEGAAP